MFAYMAFNVNNAINIKSNLIKIFMISFICTFTSQKVRLVTDLPV